MASDIDGSCSHPSLDRWRHEGAGVRGLAFFLCGVLATVATEYVLAVILAARQTRRTPVPQVFIRGLD